MYIVYSASSACPRVIPTFYGTLERAEPSVVITLTNCPTSCIRTFGRTNISVFVRIGTGYCGAIRTVRGGVNLWRPPACSAR